MWVANSYQSNSLWNWIALHNPGKNITQVIAGLATSESLSTLWHLPLLTERTTSWFSLSCSLCIFCCASEEMDCLVFLSWGCLSICNPIELSWRYVGLWCRCIGNHWKRVQWEFEAFFLFLMQVCSALANLFVPGDAHQYNSISNCCRNSQKHHWRLDFCKKQTRIYNWSIQSLGECSVLVPLKTKKQKQKKRESKLHIYICCTEICFLVSLKSEVSHCNTP